MADELAMHKETYVRLMSEDLPRQMAEIEKVNRTPSQARSAAHSKSHDDFYLEALSVAATYLAASSSALQTMTLMCKIENGSTTYCVTTNGTPALARQAMECAAMARWIVSNLDEDVIRKKGFALMWEDAKQQDLYLETMQSPEHMTRKGVRKTALIESGSQLGFLTENKLGDPIPAMTISSTTEICEAIKLPESIISSEVLAMVPGLGNASWIYRKTSGLTHGSLWATLSYSKAEEVLFPTDSHEENQKGMRVVVTSVDYIATNMAIFATLELQNEALASLRQIHGL